MSLRTISNPTQLHGTEWDVVVIGAGPAGSMTAYEIARRGRSVLLLEKSAFPRYKVCGCCLNGRALAVLDAADLGGLVNEAGGLPLSGFEVSARGRRATVRLPEGMALSREALDQSLAEAAIEAGATFLDDCKGTMKAKEADGWTIALNSRDERAEVHARLVVAAGGLGHRLLDKEEGLKSTARPASRIGAGTALEDPGQAYKNGIVHMAVGKGGYVGLVRVEGRRLNIAAAFDPRFVKECQGLSEAAATVLREAGMTLPERLETASWQGTPALTRRPARLGGERFLAIGDAAGYVEPVTGEGVAWALALGRAVAPIACESVEHFGPEAVTRWAQAHRKHVKSAQRRCRLIAAALRSPAFVAFSVAARALVPHVTSRIVKELNAPLQEKRETH